MTNPTDPEVVARTRRLLDEAMAASLDVLFQAPDVVEVVALVAEGELALTFTGGELRVARVHDPDATKDAPAVAAAPDAGPDDWRPGMYL